MINNSTYKMPCDISSIDLVEDWGASSQSDTPTMLFSASGYNSTKDAKDIIFLQEKDGVVNGVNYMDFFVKENDMDVVLFEGMTLNTTQEEVESKLGEAFVVPDDFDDEYFYKNDSGVVRIIYDDDENTIDTITILMK